MAGNRNYGVGYGRPPRHSQFKSGQSGNPNGRPKKEGISFGEALAKELDSLITIKEDGQEIKITKIEAIVKKLIHSALSGQNIRAIKIIHDCKSSYDSVNSQYNNPPRMIIMPPEGPAPPVPPIYGEDDKKDGA